MTWGRCRMQAEHNSKCLSCFSKPPSCFLEKGGCSRPRQLAPTNRYLYKVHWWIYSLSLTTEISNNLSQMPSAILDITPALTPQPPLLTFYSWCQLHHHHPPPTHPPLSVLDDDVRADQCHLFLDLIAPYACRQFTGRLEGPSSHHEQLPLKERKRESAQASSLSSPPSPPLPLPLHLLDWTLHNSSLLSGCVKHHRLFLQDR